MMSQRLHKSTTILLYLINIPRFDSSTYFLLESDASRIDSFSRPPDVIFYFQNSKLDDIGQDG